MTRDAKSSRDYFKQLYQLIVVNKKSDSLRTQLTRGAMGSFIIKITSTVLTFLISILLARILGAEEYGYYAYALAIINLLVVPTQLGLPNLIVRQVAAYKTKEQWGLMRGLLVRANQAVFIISLLLIMVSFLIAWKTNENIPSLSLPTFIIALALLPVKGLNSLRGTTLRGLNYVIIGQLPENIIRQVAFIILVVTSAFLLGFAEFDSKLAIWLEVIATFISFVVGAILLFRRLPALVKGNSAEYETRTWVKSAIPLLIVGGMNVINKRTDIIMLGLFANSEAVGIYQVVTRGTELIVFSLIAVNMVTAPVYSRFYVCNEIKKLQRVFSISSFVILLFSLPVAFILIVFGSWILTIFFGAEFEIGAKALAILSIGQLFNAGMGSVALLLNMTGNEKDSAKGVTIAAILNIMLNLLLIPKWGLEGAATATTTSVIIWNLLLANFVYKKLHIYPSVLGLKLKN